MTAEVVERMAARLDILDSQVFECLSRPPTMAEIEERFDAMLKQFGLPLGD